MTNGFFGSPSTRRLARLTKISLAAGLALLSAAALSPARADFCVQLNGGTIGGDLGFFRFSGTRPTTAGQIVTMKGRVAGLSPVFGTATVAKDGSYVEIGATFFADGTEGQIDITFFPPGARKGSGGADYGTYDVSQSVTATGVSCGLEP